MWATEELLRMENFKDLSKNDLLDIIEILRNDLKYYKYRKDANHEQVAGTIRSLKSQLEHQKLELSKVKESNNNIRNKVLRPLTFWERIKGRIDLKN
jgi:hypothetical protein